MDFKKIIKETTEDVIKPAKDCECIIKINSAQNGELNVDVEWHVDGCLAREVKNITFAEKTEMCFPLQMILVTGR